jgi:uncharacterized surface anchored protein
MKHTKKIALSLLALAALVFVPAATRALSGTNVNDVKLDVKAKLGGDWFVALNMHTDKNGVVRIKNVTPGWYKFIIDEDDEESGQTFAVQLKMLDNDGRKLKEKTDVELSAEISGTEVAIGTVETDKDGWLEVEGLSSDVPYELKISDKDKSHLSKKDGEVRIKVKAKIDHSDWFPTAYKRTKENRVLEVENVLPGKYKFKYKNGDASPAEPFTLRMRVRNEDGEKIKEATDVNLYAYVNKVRVPVGTIKTDAKGWLTVPGVLTNMKYKVDVDD